MNTNFLDSVTNFLKKRTFELLGLILVLSSVALAIAFTTYSPEDPSFIYGDRSFEIQNFFGIYGSSVADFLLQSFGLASFLLLLNFLFWGLDLIIKKELRRIILKLINKKDERPTPSQPTNICKKLLLVTRINMKPVKSDR